MDALRKAFQRAVCIPLENVETIWHDYNQFENSISKMTAKKFLQERSPAYMTARTVRRELSNFVSRLPEPALPHRPDWSRSDDREGIEAWKRYIAYEESNPLMLEDQAALRLRVQYAMRKARAALRFFPEIWFVAANYSFRNNRTDEGAKLLREGRAANPSSMLLAYSLIDFEENRRDYPTCHAIYDSLTTHYHGELTKQTTAIEAEVGEATNAVDAQLEVEIKRETADGEGNLQVRAAEERREIEAAIRGKHQRSVEATQQALSSVWVSEMRFTRRAEGMKPFRTVFTKIRKTGVLTRQVFEASAMIELHWNKDAKVATNVFELGLKTFADDPAYVLPYLDYLLSSGNESNARALFEKTVSRIEAPKAKAIWDRWAKHEYANSDQSAIQKFFERYSEAFPDSASLLFCWFARVLTFAAAPLVDRFVQRHGGFDTNEALAQEIGAADVPMSRRGSGVDSPMRIKRPLSPEPLRPVGQPALARGDANGPGAKRAKMQHARPSPSPAPSDDGHGDASHGRGAPPSGPRGYASPRPESEPQAVYFLSDRRDTVGHLPEGVAFFLSVLPAASSFDGELHIRHFVRHEADLHSQVRNSTRWRWATSLRLRPCPPRLLQDHAVVDCGVDTNSQTAHSPSLDAKNDDQKRSTMLTHHALLSICLTGRVLSSAKRGGKREEMERLPINLGLEERATNRLGNDADVRERKVLEDLCVRRGQVGAGHTLDGCVEVVECVGLGDLCADLGANTEGWEATLDRDQSARPMSALSSPSEPRSARTGWSS